MVRLTIILFQLIFLQLSVLQEPCYNDYKIKAEFIEKFSRYISWTDENNIANKTSPFEITIIGKTPLAHTLTEFYKIEKISDKPVKIKFIEKILE